MDKLLCRVTICLIRNLHSCKYVSRLQLREVLALINFCLGIPWIELPLETRKVCNFFCADSFSYSQSANVVPNSASLIVLMCYTIHGPFHIQKNIKEKKSDQLTPNVAKGLI